MNVSLVFAIVLSSISAYLSLARWSRKLRGRLGIAGGSLLSADNSLFGAPNLYSELHELVGRCDHILAGGRDRQDLHRRIGDDVAVVLKSGWPQVLKDVALGLDQDQLRYRSTKEAPGTEGQQKAGST